MSLRLCDLFIRYKQEPFLLSIESFINENWQGMNHSLEGALTNEANREAWA